MDEKFILSLFEQNKFWHNEILLPNELLLIGDSDMDFYCYNFLTKNFYTISKWTTNIEKTFISFQEMMNSVIEVYI